MICAAVSNSAGFGGLGDVAGVEQEVGRGRAAALILSMASWRVPATSWLAALLKPMWLSLIWTKEKSGVVRLHGRGGGGGGEELGGGDAAGHGPEQAGAGPGHAAEEVAAVDAVVAGWAGLAAGCGTGG